MRYRKNDPVNCRFEVSMTGSGYDPEEVEFLRAIGQYQQRHNVKFLTYTEVLKIARSLGYRKVLDPAASETVLRI